MPFSENVKQKVKERAHFKCCLCRKQWATNVHHIIPQAEDGEDDEDNAAPLCPTCHDLYGANPDKRKFIRENRDFWYDLCERSSPPDFQMIREMLEKFGKFVATKEDIQHAVSYLDDRIQNIMKQPLSRSEQLQLISDTTAAFSDAIFSAQYRCETCGCTWEFAGDETCPNCGHRPAYRMVD